MTPAARFNPFPGMRPFSVEDAGLFFGRDRLAEDVVRRLERARFVAVTGSSGAGKSSLVRAGVMHALFSRIVTRTAWRIAVVRPGSAPRRSLAEALSAPDVLGGESAKAMLDTLCYSSLGLVQAVRDAKLPLGTRVLLVIDQFEEVFRYSALGDKDEFAAFVKLLLAAATSEEAPVSVLITLRTDFLADCEEFRGLPEAISENLLLIPRMSRDELRQAIEGPATLAGADIEHGLVNRLLNDAGDERQPLGPLQHALKCTWDRWRSSSDNRPLGLADYEAVGGFARSVEFALEGIYAGLSEPAAGIARKVFSRLVEQDAEGRPTRRPGRLRELVDVAGVPRGEVIAVLDAFRGPERTFLMPGEGTLGEESILDVAHEAMVRQWSRLRTWIAEERSSGESYRRLATSAVAHAAGSASLYREPELTLALQWRERTRPTAIWAERYHPEFGAAMRFLDASRVAESRRRRSRVALVILVVVLALLALLFYSRR